jgi:DNA polymerase
MVFYRGDAPCEVLFIGEAPGKDEDLSGKPFVGKSGEILEHMIATLKEEGVKFSYGITNVVCCIPLTDPDELTGERKVRKPLKIEADACKLRLLTTIQKADPQVIVLLGETAKKYCKVPKHFKQYESPRVELKHPAYIIRNGGKNSLEFKKNYLYLKEALEQYL